MKVRPERPVRGFLKANGFYLAVAAFVIAGAGLSYAAVAKLASAGVTAPEAGDPPAAVEESAAQPTAPEPVAEQPEPEAEEAEAVVAAEPLMPVYTRPLEGALVKPFSGDELVRSATMGDWRTHNGADYAASEGDAVTAVYSGEVLSAAADDLLGNTVVLALDSGYTVLYANLGAWNGLRAGDRVSQGDVIGTVGRSALLESGEEPHLHLELRSGDTLLDPETLFN